MFLLVFKGNNDNFKEITAGQLPRTFFSEQDIPFQLTLGYPRKKTKGGGG